MVSASHTLDKLRQKDLMNCVLFLFRTDLFYFNVELFYSEYFLILTIVPPCMHNHCILRTCMRSRSWLGWRRR